MKAAVIYEHGGPGSIRYETSFPDPQARARRRGRAGARHLAQLPRHLHAPRHAGHQGADALHHGARLRRRHRRGRGRGVTDWKAGDRVLIDPVDRVGPRRPDRRDVARRSRRVRARAGPPPGAAAAGRELRAGGLSARRLRHGAAHDVHHRQDQSRRQGADPRRVGRGRHMLRAARQERRLRGDRVRQLAREARAPEGRWAPTC